MKRKYTLGINDDGLVKVQRSHDWWGNLIPPQDLHLHTTETFELADVLAEANLSDKDWEAMSESGQYQMLKNYYEHIVKGP